MPQPHAFLSPGNVRQRLLASATALFQRRGYAATSVREIVLAAGVTKPVLYHYFGSKEGIYLEIMRHVLDHFEDGLAAFRKREGSATERLLRFCDEMFRVFLAHQDRVRLMYSIYFGPPQGAPHFDFDAFYAKFIEATRQLVKEGIRAGEFRPGNPDDITRAILGAFTESMESHLSHAPVLVGAQGLNRTLRIVLTGVLSDQFKRKGKNNAGQSIRRSTARGQHRERKLLPKRDR